MEYPSLLNRGSIVSCTTCFNQTIEGGVMAYDSTTKMLILKCEAESGQAKLNDVYVVNLELCSDLKIKQEVNSIPNAPPLLNIQRISTRKRNAVDEKKRLVDALNAGVTPEGQQLFMAIAKTIGQQVTWKGPDIMVFGDTFISPPYRSENVRGFNERRVAYVKKLVDSHRKDATPPTAAPPTSSANNNSNSPVTANAPPTATGTGTVVMNSTGGGGSQGAPATSGLSSSTSASSASNNPPNSNNVANNGATSINSTPSAATAAGQGSVTAAAANPQQSNNNNSQATSGASAN